MRRAVRCRAIINGPETHCWPTQRSTAGRRYDAFLLLSLLALVATAARADDTELRQKIVGIWKLVSVVYEDQETKERTPVLRRASQGPPDRDRGRPLAGAGHRRGPDRSENR